jgi:ABC-type sugar transport system ATPase subunit
VPVFDAVDLDVMAGKVHAVVGANGVDDADPMPLN